MQHRSDPIKALKDKLKAHSHHKQRCKYHTGREMADFSIQELIELLEKESLATVASLRRMLNSLLENEESKNPLPFHANLYEISFELLIEFAKKYPVNETHKEIHEDEEATHLIDSLDKEKITEHDEIVVASNGQVYRKINLHKHYKICHENQKRFYPDGHPIRKRELTYLRLQNLLLEKVEKEIEEFGRFLGELLALVFCYCLMAFNPPLVILSLAGVSVLAIMVESARNEHSFMENVFSAGKVFVATGIPAILVGYVLPQFIFNLTVHFLSSALVSLLVTGAIYTAAAIPVGILLYALVQECRAPGGMVRSFEEIIKGLLDPVREFGGRLALLISGLWRESLNGNVQQNPGGAQPPAGGSPAQAYRGLGVGPEQLSQPRVSEEKRTSQAAARTHAHAPQAPAHQQESDLSRWLSYPRA